MNKLKMTTSVIAGVVGLGLLTWGGIYVNGFFNASIQPQDTLSRIPCPVDE